MIQKQNLIQEMNERSRIVFRNLVDSYIETGEPVGSQTLAKALTEEISPATIRNVMQDLEVLGLLDSPHVSSGRIPTQQGLRLFVDALLEVGEISNKEQEIIDYIGRLLNEIKSDTIGEREFKEEERLAATKIRKCSEHARAGP